MENGDSSFFTNQTIGIIGLGLIGGSYAKGLRRLGVQHILAVDIDEDALAQAKADGVIDEGYTAGTDALQQADMLIFCMAADAMIAFIADNVVHFKEDVLLTDVAGNKYAAFCRTAWISCPVIPWQAGKAGAMAWRRQKFSTRPIILLCRRQVIRRLISNVFGRWLKPWDAHTS